METLELNETVKELGFENEKEFYKLVASVDITTTAELASFNDWKLNDGTKKGLLKLIPGGM